MRLKLFTNGTTGTPGSVQAQVNAWLLANEDKANIHKMEPTGAFDRPYGYVMNIVYSPIEAKEDVPSDEVDVDHGTF